MLKALVEKYLWSSRPGYLVDHYLSVALDLQQLLASTVRGALKYLSV